MSSQEIEGVCANGKRVGDTLSSQRTDRTSVTEPAHVHAVEPISPFAFSGNAKRSLIKCTPGGEHGIGIPIITQRPSPG